MFTGREYLGTIQLYDYRNRTYSPKWGRFIEVDPIRFEGRDLNLYRYVRNWVMELIDPWGLDPGDKFNTADEAAYDASLYYEEKTMTCRKEYCGIICQTKDGKFEATEALEGTDSKCPDVYSKLSCPNDGKPHSAYHTHTQDNERVFTADDSNYCSDTQKDIYLYDTGRGSFQKETYTGSNNPDDESVYYEQCIDVGASNE